MDQLGGDMIRIRSIDHIVLRTARLEEMIEFYCMVLGCTVERTLPDEIGLSQLRAGDALIDIITTEGQLGRAGGGVPAQTGNNLDHFCLQIEPFQEAELLQYLSEHDIHSDGFETRYGAQGFGPSIYIKDPDGNTIELKAQQSRHPD
jgi:glyoxylase I family protein